MPRSEYFIGKAHIRIPFLLKPAKYFWPPHLTGWARFEDHPSDDITLWASSSKQFWFPPSKIKTNRLEGDCLLLLRIGIKDKFLKLTPIPQDRYYFFCEYVDTRSKATSFEVRGGSMIGPGQFDLRVFHPELNQLESGGTAPYRNTGQSVMNAYQGNDRSPLYWRISFPGPGFLGKMTFNGGELSGYSYAKSFIIESTFNGMTFVKTSFISTHFNSVLFNKCTFKEPSFFNGRILASSFTNCQFTDADFVLLNHEEIVLCRLLFSKCILHRADFTRANLSSSNLSECELDEAKLEDTDLSGAILSKVSFIDTDLRSIKIDSETKFKEINFSGANLSGISFLGAELYHCKFDGANLDQVNFKGCAMKGADFSNCDLTKAIFDEDPQFFHGADRPIFFAAKLPFHLIKYNWNDYVLAQANIVDLPEELSSISRPLQVRNADVRNLELKSKNLTSADFTDALVGGVNFSKSNLSNTTFQAADLSGGDGYQAAIFYGAFLRGSNFTSSNLSGVDFTNCLWGGGRAKVHNAIMPRTNFQGAFLIGMSFRSVKNMKGANFYGACLLNCDFTGCDFSPDNHVRGSFANACLQGVDFADTNLYSVNMTNSAIAKGSGVIKVKYLTANRRVVERNFPYQLTKITTDTTDRNSICPNGTNGPCSGVQWESSNAPMKKWQSPLIPRNS